MPVALQLVSLTRARGRSPVASGRRCSRPAPVASSASGSRLTESSSGGHRRQQMPVLARDLHHVIDARVVADLHLGQAEVGALPGVSGNDVVDDGAAVRGGHLTHRRNSASVPNASSIRVLIRSKWPSTLGVSVPAGDAAGQLDRTGVHRFDADALEDVPQVLIAPACARNDSPDIGDGRTGIGGEPDRCLLDRRPGV